MVISRLNPNKLQVKLFANLKTQMKLIGYLTQDPTARKRLYVLSYGDAFNITFIASCLLVLSALTCQG
jgi:hypothetical protein